MVKKTCQNSVAMETLSYVIKNSTHQNVPRQFIYYIRQQDGKWKNRIAGMNYGHISKSLHGYKTFETKNLLWDAQTIRPGHFDMRTVCPPLFFV